MHYLSHLTNFRAMSKTGSGRKFSLTGYVRPCGTRISTILKRIPASKFADRVRYTHLPTYSQLDCIAPVDSLVCLPAKFQNSGSCPILPAETSFHCHTFSSNLQLDHIQSYVWQSRLWAPSRLGPNECPFDSQAQVVC